MRKSMKQINSGIIFVFMIILSLFFNPTTNFATEGNKDDVAGATGFTYSINYPENQTKKDLGFFNLKMNPGQNQKISVTLSNPGSEKVIVDVQLNGAKTNQNGVIEYGESTIKNDKSLQFDFKDILTGPESIELAPGETRDIDFKIQMPESSFDGVIAGGIQLMRSNQNSDSKSNGGSKIINQYAYVIGVLLQESEKSLEPDLELNSVKAGQSNYRNAIFINFSNVIAAYLDDMTVDVKINKKGNEAVLYDRKQTAMRMAPNSFIEFPVSMNGERMEAGNYVANILVTSGEKKWAWTEDFKITTNDANKFNERDVGLVQEKGLDWKLILLIVLGILILVIIIYLIIRYVRKKKQEKEQQRKKAQRRKKKNSNGKSNN